MCHGVHMGMQANTDLYFRFRRWQGEAPSPACISWANLLMYNLVVDLKKDVKDINFAILSVGVCGSVGERHVILRLAQHHACNMAAHVCYMNICTAAALCLLEMRRHLLSHPSAVLADCLLVPFRCVVIFCDIHCCAS